MNLGKQVGPLPLGGWIVVIAGGLGIAYVINRNQASGAREPLVEPGVGTGLVPAGAVIQPPANDDTSTDPENNQAWGIRAVNWLIAQGHDPTLVDSAMRKYLSAEQLTVQENALVGLVLIRFGNPPEPLPPTAPPVDSPSEPTGAPQIWVDRPRSASVPKGVWTTVNGRVFFGSGESTSGMGASSPGSESGAPGTPQAVRVEEFAGSVPVGMHIVMTNSNGDFSTRIGTFGSKKNSRRRYTFNWNGVTVERFHDVTR